MRGNGIDLKLEPITFVSGVSTCSRSQSHVEKGYLPGAGNHHTRGRGIYEEKEPITRELIRNSIYEKSIQSQTAPSKNEGFLP